MVSCVTHDAKLFLPMEELVDVDKELARIAKEKEKVQKGLAGVQAKLGNPGFAAKAPEQVVPRGAGESRKVCRPAASARGERSTAEGSLIFIDRHFGAAAWICGSSVFWALFLERVGV